MKKDCSVTIHNDASLTDGHGIVHTWIEVNKPGEPPVVISFSADSAWSAGAYKPGVMNEHRELSGRPSDSTTIPITRDHADKMIEEHKKHVSNDNDKKNGIKKEPPYDISPDHNGDYNCVTYADKVL